MQYIPGTDIESTVRHVAICKAPAGKFRVVSIDTVSGNFDLLLEGDFDDLETAKSEAEQQTGGRITTRSEQTYYKVYVFDHQLQVFDVRGQF